MNKDIKREIGIILDNEQSISRRYKAWRVLFSIKSNKTFDDLDFHEHPNKNLLGEYELLLEEATIMFPNGIGVNVIKVDKKNPYELIILTRDGEEYSPDKHKLYNFYDMLSSPHGLQCGNKQDVTDIMVKAQERPIMPYKTTRIRDLIQAILSGGW